MAKIICFISLVLFWSAPLTTLAQARGVERLGGPEIYGRELMTPQERDAYRERMWNLRTESERERFSLDYQRRMQERAIERRIPPPQGEFTVRKPLVEGRDEGIRADDGLRRLGPHENSAASPLRQWPLPSAESRRGDGIRRLPDQFRHEERERQPARRIPGAGRIGGQ